MHRYLMNVNRQASKMTMNMSYTFSKQVLRSHTTLVHQSITCIPIPTHSHCIRKFSTINNTNPTVPSTSPSQHHHPHPHHNEQAQRYNPPPYIHVRHTARSDSGREPITYYTADPNRKRRDMIDTIIRVDHAGEYGAQRIYDGQLSVLRYTRLGGIIDEMREQELDHLRRLNRLVVERRVRPTLLMPLWNITGYMLGYVSALLGHEAAMACTVAVENVITEHYNDQLRELSDKNIDDEDVRYMVRKHRDDEEEHADIGIEYDAEHTPMYSTYTQAIGTACRAAVYVAQRV